MADDFDALLNESSVALDHDKRTTVWPRPQKVYGDDAPITTVATWDREGRQRRLQLRRLAAESVGNGRTQAWWVWA